jgi:hypothetical protein
MGTETKKHSAYRRAGILLIVIGGLLAIDTFTELAVIYKFWPVITLMLGVGLVEIFRRRSRKESPYLVLGVYLIGFSGLALWCNFTTWSILARWWPLFISFLGAGFVAAFFLSSRRKVFLVMGLLLLSIAVGFLLIFVASPQLWWSVFILAGLSIVVSEWAT